MILVRILSSTWSTMTGEYNRCICILLFLGGFPLAIFCDQLGMRQYNSFIIIYFFVVPCETLSTNTLLTISADQSCVIDSYLNYDNVTIDGIEYVLCFLIQLLLFILFCVYKYIFIYFPSRLCTY